MDKIRPSCQVDMELRTLKQRLLQLVSALRSHNPPYMPRVLDLYSLDTVREVLDQPLEDNEDTVTVDSFATPLSNFSLVMEHCRTMRISEALQALRKCDDVAEELNEDHLALATSVFRCNINQSYSACRARLANARELAFHHCGFVNPSGRPWEEDWEVRDRQQQLKLVLGWVEDAGGKGTICVNEGARMKVARLVKSLSLDPRTATSADMDELNARFKCSSSFCLSNRSGTTYNWRQAVRNRYLSFSVGIFTYLSFQVAHDCPIDCITRMTPKEEEKARTIAASHGITLPQSYDVSEIWSCVHCSKSHMMASEFRHHCRSVYVSPEGLL
jgi:hypothetical protein